MQFREMKKLHVKSQVSEILQVWVKKIETCGKNKDFKIPQCFKEKWPTNSRVSVFVGHLVHHNQLVLYFVK